MRLQDLNWMDIERYLERDTRIILITGATEQHAYLSLLSDILIPERVADAVAKRENVLVAPPFNFGVSYYFREYPGTISISQHTFDHVILEVFESLSHQGFEKFLILNGHGGNQMPERLVDFQDEASAVRVLWHNWWKSEKVNAFAEKHNLPQHHANWSENFPFTRVAESPKESKPPVDGESLGEPYAWRAALGDGSFGGPYQVSDEIMNALFDLLVEEVAGLVRSLGQKTG